MPTREEYVAQVEEEMEELYTRLGREANEAAIAAREDEPDTAETEEEYYFRIAHVPGIFGDTPTEFDAVVPTKNEEAAGVAVAEADSSDEVEDDVSLNEKRRQVDVAADTVPSAEEAEEVAEEEGNTAEDRAEDDDSDSDVVVNNEEAHEDVVEDSAEEAPADDSADEAVSADVEEAPETQDAREGAAVDPAHPELAGDVQNGETEVPVTEVVASEEEDVPADEDAEHAE